MKETCVVCGSKLDADVMAQYQFVKDIPSYICAHCTLTALLETVNSCGEVSEAFAAAAAVDFKARVGVE